MSALGTPLEQETVAPYTSCDKSAAIFVRIEPMSVAGTFDSTDSWTELKLFTKCFASDLIDMNMVCVVFRNSEASKHCSATPDPCSTWPVAD